MPFQKDINHINYKHGNYCKDKIHYCIELSCNDIVSGPNRRCRKCSKNSILNPMYRKIPIQKNKNYEEYYGKVKAIKIKKKISKNRKGKGIKPKKYYYCIDCRKEISSQGIRCYSCANFIKQIGRKATNKAIANMSLARKKLWKNKKYRNKILTVENRQKILTSLLKFPSKPEIRLNNILSQLIPKKYEYTGNGSFMVEAFNPDFINKKDKKIIEMFGDYWHNLPSYKKRDYFKLKVYKRNSYKTLIIWEHELKNLKKLKLKILKFDK